MGGKAAGLAAVARAGVPTPPGFVIPVEVQAVSKVGLPPAWRAALVEAARSLGGPVAVRSSATVEDGAEASFAGQFESVLGVAPEDVVAAVQRVWDSASSARAAAYGASAPPMAVVVQRMLEPETAGVMFTIDPVSGSWRELVVEAVWGLADGLVAGRTTPQVFTVRRPRWLPRGVGRLWSRARVRELRASEPRQRFVESAEGRRPLPAVLAGKRVLSSSAVRRLARLGLRLERHFGRPMDVEWVRTRDGRTWVVQARPVTTTAPPTDDVLWTRRFIGERWPIPATPMGWSLVGPVLSWFIAYPQTQRRFLGGGDALREVDGHPYVNATVFRHLAFKAPGRAPPAFMTELLPSDETAAMRGRYAVAPDLRVYASILAETVRERRWERFAWNPFTNHLEWRRWVSETALDEGPPTSVDDAVARIERGIGHLRGYVGIHVASLLFANLFFQLLHAELADADVDLLDALATSPPGNRTLRTNHQLWLLARHATLADLEALRQDGPLSPGFAEALSRFLEAYGDRAEASWEVFAPRWRDRPRHLVPLLKAALADPVDPDLRASRQQSAWAAAVREVTRAVPAARVPVVLGLAHYTRRYLLLRENQRGWLERLMTGLQRDLRYLGATLVARGVIDRADEVAWLGWPEVRDLLRSPDCRREEVVRRRDRWKAAKRSTPPTFLSRPTPPETGRLQGVGVSAGCATGRVRVLRSLADAERFQPGEVLVTSAIDPGWTPLFLTASAVVVELGGALAHGAVVAREYRLPMVVNLEGAMQRLADGVEVTVDGSTGAVWTTPVQ